MAPGNPAPAARARPVEFEKTPASAYGGGKAEPAPVPAVQAPPVEFEKTPASAFGGAEVAPAPAPAAAVAQHPPQGTLISTQNEAAELRRRIANPGIPEPEPEIEMDLEELDEVAEPTHGQFVPEAAPRVPPRGSSPAVPRAAEVEVPIDIEVAPGTTRVSLNIRLVLNLKPRR